jgi:lysophospholipase L1-like esterase
VALVAPGTWVVMGSSTASGAGAKTLAWADAVRLNYAARSVSLVNIAKGATTTYAGLPTSSTPVAGRPAPDPTANVDAAIARSPKLLLVSYPTNDTAFGYTVDETVRNLLAIRSAAQAGGASVIILSTQPAALTTAQLALLPQIDARVSAAVAPCFVAVREALAGPDGKLNPIYDSGDGEHPNDAGHAVIASKVESVIDSGACVRTQ